jgi:hypothetical protein
VAFNVTDWNVFPNQRFYVKVSDIGSKMRVELFNTAADAAASTNRVASADVDFGSDVPVLLVADATLPSSGDPLTKFNPSLSYHLKADGSDSDPTKTFAVGPFTDLPPVEDPLILSEAMADARATLEINKGTHMRVVRNFAVNRHHGELEQGDIITITSTKRGIASVRNRIENITLEARLNGRLELVMHDFIETVEFVDFARQP